MSIPAARDAISRLTLGEQLRTHLAALPGVPAVSVYAGEIPTSIDGVPQPPVTTVNGEPDPAGRVAPYVVLYTSAGTPVVDDERDVADRHVDLTQPIQLTVAAGYLRDLERTLDRLVPHLTGWRPTVPGLAFAGLRVPPGYDPGPIRRDNDVAPPRFWTPLQYQLRTTT